MEAAIGAGADEILLPMVRLPEEVKAVLEQAGERCGVGILVETLDALAMAPALARFPLARVYVGLNDLSIERGSNNLFEAVADGTVARLRIVFDGVSFGFAGLTLPDKGYPIPCRLLIGEMASLGCNFSFLRRSFHRDIRGRNPEIEIPRLLDAFYQAYLRPPEAVAREKCDLEAAIRAWPQPVSPPLSSANGPAR